MSKIWEKYRSGFRTPEGNAFYHQIHFFNRFLDRYPAAINELRQMLPLFERVFGKALEMNKEEDFWSSRQFSQYYLAPNDQILRPLDPHRNYGVDVYRWKHRLPDCIRLSNDDPNKHNEEYHRAKLETGLLWTIADLQVESGDTWLKDFLVLQKTQIHGTAVKIDKLLDNYWSFYEQFHSWLEKYCLQKHWLRGSFFISLRRGLKVFWPDIRNLAHLPLALVQKLHKHEMEAWSGGYVRLPSPEDFVFDLTERTAREGNRVINATWQVDCYWIFYPPEDFIKEKVREFELNLEKFPFFEGEKQILDSFASYLNGSRPDLSAEQRNLKVIKFRTHVANFPDLREALDEREYLGEAFQKHINDYLDELLPTLAEHFLTNKGRPPKVERVEWLLYWNIEGFSARQIMDKFSIDTIAEKSVSRHFGKKHRRYQKRLMGLNVTEECSIWGALRALKRYNLPVRSKKGEPVAW